MITAVVVSRLMWKMRAAHLPAVQVRLVATARIKLRKLEGFEKTAPMLNAAARLQRAA
jgi:hypothetical protein